MFNKLRTFSNNLTDDISQKKAFAIGTYAVLCVVALVMTILNIFTDKGFLTICTGAFSGLCVINIVLALIHEKTAVFAKMLFSVEVVLMFTFFLVSGNPEGFSAIWICMLPSLGMFFFGRNRGTWICIAMFFILIFFLWTDTGGAYLQYEYTATFKMRFPVLFVAFHLLAFLLETLRANAYLSMKRMQSYYQDLSVRDQLTGMFNRQGMYSALETREEYRTYNSLGAVIFDIDSFKNVNDTHGHTVGDTVLKEFAAIIKSNLHAVVCRWGGEEFVAVFTDQNVTAKDLERVRLLIKDHPFESDQGAFHITVSGGVCVSEKFDIARIDQLINAADKALYNAKNSGKDKIIYHDLPK